MSKPSIPQGTRDFAADVVRKRNFIFNTIKNVFELYGFQPLETPAMENLDTLMGKYGDEGDKLIFKVLNNGLDNAEKEKLVREEFEKILKGKISKTITERALKYDLTIPFARYVAMNHAQLAFPFKRYQVQPVWRADRPQKSRYREFYQCDADVVGSNSLLNEAELSNIYTSVFQQLNIPVEIKLNHRKILAALAELCDSRLTDITVAIDKLEKSGLEKVKQELAARGLKQVQLDLIEKYLAVSGSNLERLSRLKDLLGNSPNGKQGIEELETILEYPLINRSVIIIDPSLARGLNYYTGTIYEVTATNVKMGSIGGGGRYDDLTGLFGVSGIPGVGISFGVDRIYDVMEELNLFPAELYTGTEILFFNLGENESMKAFELAEELRKKKISCEVYHEQAKFDKQFRYAEKKKIPFIAIIGEEELRTNSCKIKNLAEGRQVDVAFNDIAEFLLSSHSVNR